MLRTNLTLVSTLLGLILGSPSASHAEMPDPLEWLRALDAPEIDESAAVAVNGLELSIGPAQLVLEQGVLVPTKAVGGFREEAVFVGSGRFRYNPPDPIERGQVQLFARKCPLDEPFKTAVVGGAGFDLDRILASGTRTSDPASSTASGSLRAWVDGPARMPSGIPEQLLQARIDAKHAGGYRFAALEAGELGSLLISLDRNDANPFSLWGYEAVELSDWEQRRIRQSARRHLKAGRLTFLRDLDHRAVWDLWSEGLATDNREGLNPFLGSSYSLDVTIETGGERIHGTNRMRVVNRGAGERMIQLRIGNDLSLTSLRGEAGESIPFRQRHGVIWAWLPEPLPPGSERTLLAEFSGTLFEKTEQKRFRSWRTLLWHPHVPGEYFAVAEIELTVRWPSPLDVRVGGERVGQGIDDGQKWVRHHSVGPALGLFLEIGRFEDLTEKVGEHQLTISFSEQNQSWMKKDGQKTVLEHARQILSWMEQELGPYPFGDLSIVIVDQWFGQAQPGTVIYPDYALRFSTAALRSDADDWRLMLAHEVAHQWWGAGVRPKRAADNWLSEGLAEYLSQLYGRRYLESEKNERYVAPTKAWRRALEVAVDQGQPVESIGPIVLGERLDSSRCQNCEAPIVYGKSALALEILGQYIGEERFLKMLREVFKRAAGKALSGREFLSMIATMSGTDLSWFEKRYLLSTGSPRITYSYRVEPAAAGGWDVGLTLRQEPRFLYRLRAADRGQGRFDAELIPVPRLELGSEPLPVPFVLRVVNPAEPELAIAPNRKRAWRDRANWRLNGRVFLDRPEKEAKIHSEFEVVEVVLDPDGTLLADVRCESCRPKPVFRMAAARELEAGHLDEADALITRALTAELDNEPPPKDPGEKITRRRTIDSENAALHFLRSELALRRGDLAAATASLETGAALVSDQTSDWVVLDREQQRARIYLAKGEDRKAHQALWSVMQDDDSPESKTLLLAAIAAHRANEVETYEKMMRRLKQRLVDVEALEAVRPLRKDEADTNTH